MNTAMYKVVATFSAVKDDYELGETGEYGADWTETREFATLPEVKEFIKDNTYSGYEYIEYDDYLKRYVTAYTTTDDNEGEMDEDERKQWVKGEINGWTVNCDITVQKFTPKTIGNIKFN
jgi:hypothetical protein